MRFLLFILCFSAVHQVALADSEKPKCLESAGKTKCGYGCIQTFGEIHCGKKPGMICLESMGKVKCGYDCKADFGKIECGTKPQDNCVAAFGQIKCGEACREEMGRIQCGITE